MEFMECVVDEFLPKLGSKTYNPFLILAKSIVPKLLLCRVQEEDEKVSSHMSAEVIFETEIILKLN